MGAVTRALLLVLSLAACAPAAVAPAPVETGHPVQPVFENIEEQEILTAVPVRLRLPSWVRADRVLLHFRTFGTREWTTLELGGGGSTWAGTVPCLEVSTITGELEYYVTAFDDDRLVLSTGTRSWPHTVTVRYRLESGPRGLGGAPRPLRCPDPADCPPDFPGCPVALR